MSGSDLTDPDLTPLWRAVADRLAQGHPPAAIQRVRVTGLSRTGHAMLSGWLARDPHASGRRTSLPDLINGTTTVPLAKILQALRMPPDQLPSLVEQVVGPIPDRAGQRQQASQLRSTLWTHAQRLLADTPRLLARLRAAGVIDGKVGDLHTLVNALGRARTRLPLSRPAPLARLALACAGDPHYFDLSPTRHGDKLVLLAIDLLRAPEPDTPAGERAALARVGIIADRLSQTVLTLNLDATGDGPSDRALRLAHADRRPLHLTLYDLTTDPPAFSAATPWLIVENTSVLDEALLRGVTFPVVCTSGNLTAVDHVLLALAHDAGVELRYAGDLDVGGVAVAETVRSRYGGQPWHMDADSIRNAVDAGPLATEPAGVPVLDGPSHVPLNGPLIATWDPEVTGQASVAGRVVFQEHPVILDQLLGPDPDDPLRVPRTSTSPDEDGHATA